jgi:hypothetical protein
MVKERDGWLSSRMDGKERAGWLSRGMDGWLSSGMDGYGEGWVAK